MRTIKPASEAWAIPYKEDTLIGTYAKECIKKNDSTTEFYRQLTIKSSVQIGGTERNGKQSVTMTLRPAPVNTGIVFRFSQIETQSTQLIKIRSYEVVSVKEYNNLAYQNIAVEGAEHLLSAFAGLGIDNIYVDLNNTALPIMDESAEPFVFLMRSVGFKRQDALKQFIFLKKKVHFSNDTGWISAEPDTAFRLTCTLPTHSLTQSRQQYSLLVSEATYTKLLSRARHGVEQRPTTVWRYSDEYLRHHVLDTIGELYALGYTILGKVTSYNTNTQLNQQFIKYLLNNPQMWELRQYPFDQHKESETVYY